MPSNDSAQGRREGNNLPETESLSRRCLKRPGGANTAYLACRMK